ncbi:ABC transporter permease [Mesoaciditoga lauensis]|uniref:ABC transporter permease n=1 Tax=Mesoaciditoga lauensis TaxID=1495039 RepID=UPI00056A94CD|nr:ABC transporter permease [Mesoaciditoga lauensis]
MEKYKGIIIITVSFLLALVVGGLLMLLYHVSPIDGYKEMVIGALGNKFVLYSTLARMVPILLTGLSIAISFHAGIWNIGAQGQLYLAAFMVAAMGVTFHGIPSVLYLTLGVSVGLLVGGLWAWIPGYLKVKYNVNEVVLTIMMNSIAVYFTLYMVNGPFRTTEGSLGATNIIDKAMWLKHLNPLSNLNTGIYIALAATAVIIYLMLFSKYGYEWKMSRLNIRFSIYGGVNVKKNLIMAMVISGMLAGLAGTILVMGDYHRFLNGISPGYSWTGMILAMMVNYDPIGVIITSFIYAVMASGGLQMELALDIPQELVQIIFVLSVMFVTAGYSMANRVANRIQEEG